MKMNKSIRNMVAMNKSTMVTTKSTTDATNIYTMNTTNEDTTDAKTKKKNLLKQQLP